MLDPTGQPSQDQARMHLARGLTIALCSLLYLMATWSVAGAPLYAQGPHRVGLVVYKGDAAPVTRCIEFSEPTLSGYEVLQRSGLDLGIEGNSMGASICRIDGQGCNVPEQSCFCGMENGKSDYWSYWQLREGGWSYASLGASNAVVQPGMVEGWRWGPGNVAGATPPPPIRLEEICPVATPTPTATWTPFPTATDALTPTPTVTETPAPTPTPTDTPWPSATPTFVQAATPTWTPSPTWAATSTPLPTWTPDLTQAAALPTDLAPTPSPIPSPTPTPSPTLEPVTAAQPVDLAAPTPHYAAHLPLVHGKAAAAALPTTPSQPDEPRQVAVAPLATLAPAVATVATVAPQVDAPVNAPVDAPMAAPATPAMIVVVVTATPTATPIATDLVPVAEMTLPAAPAAPAGLTLPLGMLALGGAMLLAPFGLLLVVLAVYAIARRL